MGADDEGLLDVSSLGGPRDEQSEAPKIHPRVGFLHVVDDLTGAHNQGHVLRNHKRRAMSAQNASRNPDGRILGDSKLAGQNDKIQILQIMWSLGL
jgi:hypothetical protein